MSRTLLTLSLSASLMGGTALADVPNVAADIAPIHSLVARVMEGVGTPDLIVQSGASPHEYSLRPSEAAALQNANLVFWVGPDLTPWLEGAIETIATDAVVTELMEADGTIELPFREGALFEAHSHGDEDHAAHGDEDDGDHEEHDHDEHGEDDHDDHEGHDHEDPGEEDHDDHEGHDHEEHGDEDHDDHEGHDHDEHAGHGHGAHDPHVWLSPDNAATWLNVIAAQLSAADPDNAGTYFANAASARSEIVALVEEVNAILDPVRGGNFIVFHDAYQYFETTFDFPASGAISLSDASDPSPARIAEIQDRIAAEGVDCVLAEPQFNMGLVETALDGTTANTGVMDPLGSDLELGSGLYPQLIRNLAGTLADCL
ncbi:zinc ABC transporter substrate-binding protein [Rhodobacteraceae bacterium M385]|nr:zinc ABC transporter substrate-binding protein [Rhodobacteraceae bacterium M385]